MINLISYFMGRDVKYAAELTDDIRKNAGWTISRVNQLLVIYEESTGRCLTKVSSGWRPTSVNDATSNAAKSSTHITADGCDVEDLDRHFAAWCVANPHQLAICGLWMEDPRWTPTWVHLQTRPPKSGKRIYIPSAKPALASALPGQKSLPLVVKV